MTESIMIIMEKQPEEQSPPISYEAYLRNHQQRMALRSVNFDRSSQALEGKPKTAQIKAIQKFIVKLKIQGKNYEAILAEMGTLNLSKYLEQISALIATCVNQREIRFYSEVATRLNDEYEDFPAMILKDINKQFAAALQSTDDSKQKLKALLLFTTELFVCGFTFPYKEISEMLKKLVKAGTKKKNNFTTEKELRLFAYFYNCDSYASFLVNFGSIFTQSTAKWVQKWQREGKELVRYPEMIPSKAKEDITNSFFANYVISCAAVLEAAFTKLKELQGELRENLRMTGEFSKQVESSFNDLKEKFLFTKQQLETIMQAIGQDSNLRNYQSQLVAVEDIMKQYINKAENAEIFQNQFERELYLDLPDLCKAENKAAGEDEYKEFKQKLEKCKNKSESDEIARLFEGINNKRTRRLLGRDIMQYRKEYQLVTPFLCRISAIVAINFRDIQEGIVDSLFADYERLRENINTNFVINDKRSRNLKYICEFTKFKLVDNDRTIACLQNLIDDLKGYNIELLIAALESVGRFLYLSSVSANKFTFLLSKLENVLKQKSFPLFTTSQLLNSISLLKPHQELPKPQEPEPTPIEKEAQRIMQMDVIDQLDDMIREIMKMMDKKGGVEALQASLIKQIERYEFLGNYNYTYMISELSIPAITDYVVVKTIERLQQATRNGNYQNCLLWSRFFGELFKYSLVKRSFLFESLNNFLRLSNVNDVSIINLICTVLESCQRYLDSKKAASRNQTFMFLVEFRKYINKRSYVPMLEEFKIIDVFQEFQPNLISIKTETIEAFFTENEANLSSKDCDMADEFDIYLDRKNLKEIKRTSEKEPKDVRLQEPEPEKAETTSQKNLQAINAQSKTFEGEFLNIMNSHIKDLSGKIAKPTFVEKVIDRRKDKRKLAEGQRKIVVIARNGNRFTKKDIVYTSKEQPNGNN